MNIFERNYYFVSRAATAIYLILKTELCNCERKTVVAPANICYAAIFPILYAGFNVRFCDVDPLTGNVTYKSFFEVCDGDVAAAVLPHMYGNPISELREISEFCSEKGILLIEDCASAMGAESIDYQVSCQGDYAIFSMGYSKTIDLGYGGLVVSDRDLISIVNEEKELPYFSGDDKELALFSKIYRVLRNNNTKTNFEGKIYDALFDVAKPEFLCRIDDKQREYLKYGLGKLESVIKERKNMQLLYKKELASLNKYIYSFSPGAVPWRFCMLLDTQSKREIIDKCLANNLPVSDWYPNVTNIFNDGGYYPGADAHEKAILNFPLLQSAETTERICEIINTVLGKMKSL